MYLVVWLLLYQKQVKKVISEVTCGQVWWPILGICALHLTHPSAHTQQWTNTHTHCEHTPGAVRSQCCGARGAVGGSVPCSRVSPQLWYWRWRERWLFTPPTDKDANPWPSGYNFDSLSIRLRLPPQNILYHLIFWFLRSLTYSCITEAASAQAPKASRTFLCL